MVKDVVKCFMCSVKGIEKTFNTYDELRGFYRPKNPARAIPIRKPTM